MQLGALFSHCTCALENSHGPVCISRHPLKHRPCALSSYQMGFCRKYRTFPVQISSPRLLGGCPVCPRCAGVKQCVPSACRAELQRGSCLQLHSDLSILVVEALVRGDPQTGLVGGPVTGQTWLLIAEHPSQGVGSRVL